jgi:2-methylcitrate dehydratase
LFLSPFDYGYDALYNKSTRKLISKVTFEHGGKEYDEKYPEGIPGRVIVKMKDGK